MPRKPRVHFPGAIYHVVARGNGKQTIFHDQQDFLKYLFILQDALSVLPFHILAYALMINHVHLLVEVEAAPLGLFIKSIHQRFAQYYNSKYDTCGHVFQGRYSAFVVDAENYFITLLQYINFNPVKAGFVTDVKEYRWTGHHEIISGKNYIINQPKLLGYLADTPKGAMERYFSLMSQQALLDELPNDWYLDGAGVAKKNAITKESEETAEVLLDSARLMELVCNVLGVDQRFIAGQSKQRKIVKARNIFIYLARQHLHVSTKELTRMLDISPGHVSKVCQKVQALINNDMDFNNSLNRACEAMDKWKWTNGGT